MFTTNIIASKHRGSITFDIKLLVKKSGVSALMDDALNSVIAIVKHKKKQETGILTFQREIEFSFHL